MARHMVANDNTGVGMIERAQGLAALTQLWQANAPAQVGVFPMDWKKYFNFTRINKPWLSQLRKTAIIEKQASNMVRLTDLLASAAPDDYEQIIKLHLETLLRKTLQLDQAIVLDENMGFFELGMDSLMAVEFQNHLETSLDKRLPVTDIFNNATIHSLYQEVIKLLNIVVPEKNMSAPSQVEIEVDAALQDEFANMTPEEISRFIKEETL